MDTSGMYEISDNQERSSYPMQLNSSNKDPYQEINKDTQEAPSHYQELQNIVDHKHLANRSNYYANVSTKFNRDKRTCCTAIVALISIFLTLGAVTLIAINFINQSSQQSELDKLNKKLTTITENNISQVLHQLRNTEGNAVRLMNYVSTLSKLLSQNNATQVLDELSEMSNEKDARLMSEIGSLNNQLSHLISKVHSNISQLHAQVAATTNNVILRTNCGEGTWHRIAFLNMSKPSQTCPSPWRLYSNSTYGVRACGRPFSTSSGCSPRYYYPNRRFNRVCGRVIGYQIASPDGFRDPNRNINQVYIDGVSICIYRRFSQLQRTHIWSYVGGYNEKDVFPSVSTDVNSFVGSNYYCESAFRAGISWSDNQLYASDPLWDGYQCEVACCTGAPWFSVQLPANAIIASDSIEVRICGDENTANENTPINLLEIYVQ
jgi:hypothetical protein